MEAKDEQLILSLVDRDPDLKRFYDEHVQLEKQLAQINHKGFLNQDEEVEKKAAAEGQARGQRPHDGDSQQVPLSSRSRAVRGCASSPTRDEPRACARHPAPRLTRRTRQACDTPFPSWSRTNSASSRASPGCSAAAASTSRASRSPRPWTRPCRASRSSRAATTTSSSRSEAAQQARPVIRSPTSRTRAHVERELVLIKVTADEQHARRAHEHRRHLPRQDHRRRRRARTSSRSPATRTRSTPSSSC